MGLSKNHTREMIEAIKLEREQVAKEIDRLFDKLGVLESTLTIYGVKALRPRAKKPQPISEPPHQRPMPIGEAPDYSGLTQAEAAYRYLVETGISTHVDEIVDALLRRGITMKGGDEKLITPKRRRIRLKQSLVSTLTRHTERFKNIGRNHFMLVEEQAENEGLLNDSDPALSENVEEAVNGFEVIGEAEIESVEDPFLEREYE